MTKPPDEFIDDNTPRYDKEGDPGYMEFPLHACRREIRTIVLRGHSFIALRPEMSLLDNLESLEIHRTGLRQLDPALAKLPRLKSLNLFQNELPGLPDWIGDCPALEELRYRYEKSGPLPASIGRLGRLRVLDLQGTMNAVLPREIGQLAALETLNLAGCLLPAIPEETGACMSLRELDLSGNRLADLPASLDTLPRLERIRIDSNPLRKLPRRAVPDARGAMKLDLSNLEDLPATFRQLAAIENLRSLSLWRWPGLTLPGEIGLLTGLTGLEINYSPALTSLPDGLGALAGLKSLSVYKTALLALPPTAEHLSKLERLHLEQNALTPEAIQWIGRTFGGRTSDLRVVNH